MLEKSPFTSTSRFSATHAFTNRTRAGFQAKASQSSSSAPRALRDCSPARPAWQKRPSGLLQSTQLVLTALPGPSEEALNAIFSLQLCIRFPANWLGTRKQQGWCYSHGFSGGNNDLQQATRSQFNCLPVQWLFRPFSALFCSKN